MSPENIWYQSLRLYGDRRVAVVFFMGFSCGIPLLLTASTLSIWLGQQGIQYRDIGFMALAALPYTFKFAWAPLVDRLEIPFFTSFLGRRRAWLLLSQLILIIAIFCLGQVDPKKNLELVVLFSFIIAFASATQDIVMLVYQVERLRSSQYGAGEAAGIFGYRLGILLAGAGALYLAEFVSWEAVYSIMAAATGVGVVTTLVCEEPHPLVTKESVEIEQGINHYLHQKPQLKKWQANLLAWLYGAVICPFIDYMRQKGWFTILLVMFFYKLGDNMIGNMQNLFYVEIGFSKMEIANASKIFGMWSSIFGGFIGGIFVVRYGMIKSLFYMAALHGVAMMGYLILSYAGNNLALLYATVAIEDITGGMRLTALFAYQMTLCSPVYAATQLALLTSIVHLGRVLFSAPSGWIIEQIGWNNFFALSVLSNIPVLVLVWWLSRLLDKPLFRFAKLDFWRTRALKFP